MLPNSFSLSSCVRITWIGDPNKTDVQWMKAFQCSCKHWAFFVSSCVRKHCFRCTGNEKSFFNRVEEAFIRVIPFGFEPKTYCLEGSCSIQLSYRTNIKQTITPFICLLRLEVHANIINILVPFLPK